MTSNPQGIQHPEATGASLPSGLETTSIAAINVTQILNNEVGTSNSITTAQVQAIALLPAGTALLVVKEGPNSGARFLLDSDVTPAGRQADNEIFLDDVTVSRRHAEFVRTEQGFIVRDVGSLNGTYVQRERVDEYELQIGDVVQIGKFRLVYFPSQQA